MARGTLAADFPPPCGLHPPGLPLHSSSGVLRSLPHLPTALQHLLGSPVTGERPDPPRGPESPCAGPRCLYSLTPRLSLPSPLPATGPAAPVSSPPPLDPWPGLPPAWKPSTSLSPSAPPTAWWPPPPSSPGPWGPVGSVTLPAAPCLLLALEHLRPVGRIGDDTCGTSESGEAKRFLLPREPLGRHLRRGPWGPAPRTQHCSLPGPWPRIEAPVPLAHGPGASGRGLCAPGAGHFLSRWIPRTGRSLFPPRSAGPRTAARRLLTVGHPGGPRRPKGAHRPKPQALPTEWGL